MPRNVSQGEQKSKNSLDMSSLALALPKGNLDGPPSAVPQTLACPKDYAQPIPAIKHVLAETDSAMASGSSSASASPKPQKQKPPTSLTVRSTIITPTQVPSSSRDFTSTAGTRSKSRPVTPGASKSKSPAAQRSHFTLRKNKKSDSNLETAGDGNELRLDLSGDWRSRNKDLSSDDGSLEGAVGLTPCTTPQKTPSHSRRMSGGSDSSRKTPKTPRKSPRMPFEPYMSLEEVQRGLKKGELIEGVLRINPKNFEDSYISAPDGQMDIYIGGIHDRNRALNGDVVVVQLYPKQEWKVLSDNLRDCEARKQAASSLSVNNVNVERQIDTPRPIGKWIPEAHNNTHEPSKKTKRGKKGKKKGENPIAVNSGTAVNSVPESSQELTTTGSLISDISTNVASMCKVEKSINKETLDPHANMNTKKKRIRSKKKKNIQARNINTHANTESSVPVSNLLNTSDPMKASEEFNSEIASEGIKNDSEAITESVVGISSVINTLNNHHIDSKPPVSIGACVAPHELSDVEEIDSANEGSIGNNQADSQVDVNFTLERGLAQDVASIEDLRQTILLWPIGNNGTNTGWPIDEDVKTPSTNSHHPITSSIIPNSPAFDGNSLVDKSRHSSHNDKLPIEVALQHPQARKFVQKTGKVVYIIEKKHSRAAAGYIKPMQDKNPNWALFSPHDHRLPRIMVPLSDCPNGFLAAAQDYAKTLFVARLTEWEDTGFARGRIFRSLGEGGEIVPETEAMLIENSVDYAEFPDVILNDLPALPDGGHWNIPKSELSKRRDFRKHCVVTIDPPTARDLDDALHCTSLGNGIYEVGVHIADVSYFVKEGTKLDEVAASRATSVYLVHMVVPMLPRLLCEELCSLNPGTDRLTMSVVWKMTEGGDVLEEWFGRSVICSCAKLSYNHAQKMIENEQPVWNEGELPPIAGDHSVGQVVTAVQNLQRIAVNLRAKRFTDGALRLDQVKLQFTLEQETGLPSGFCAYEYKDSNKLIEEFMLLANMAVAHQIYNGFPEKAMLRRHPPPQDHMMDEIVEMFATVGVHIDTSSAGTIQESLNRLYQCSDEYTLARCLVLTNLLSKPMQRALYFCSGCIEETELYRHYALNVPLYTHFTSPIRRYPDVVVHRLLAACLGDGIEPQVSKERLQRNAEWCNDKKYNAKVVQELSQDMFVAIFVKNCGSCEEIGMVLAVLDHSFDVLILRMGVIKRVYCDQLPLKARFFQREQGVPHLRLTWKSEDNQPEQLQVITIFTTVNLVLTPCKEPLKYNAVIKRPPDTPFMAPPLSG